MDGSTMGVPREGIRLGQHEDDLHSERVVD